MDKNQNHFVISTNLLRDFFAAHALSGILASTPGCPLETLTNDAYLYADAMLNARAKQCQECGGLGVVDSGGMSPQGHEIKVECPACSG